MAKHCGLLSFIQPDHLLRRHTVLFSRMVQKLRRYLLPPP